MNQYETKENNLAPKTTKLILTGSCWKNLQSNINGQKQNHEEDRLKHDISIAFHPVIPKICV